MPICCEFLSEAGLQEHIHSEIIKKKIKLFKKTGRDFKNL